MAGNAIWARRMAAVWLMAGLAMGTGRARAAAVEPIREWSEDVKAALERAKDEDRFVVVFFTSAESLASEKMESETLGLSAVRKAIENFVKIKVIAERNQEYARFYNIQRYPTVIFFDSQSRELDRFSGFADPTRFLRNTVEAISEKTNYQLLKERLKKDPGDIEALYYMGFKYTRRNDWDRAEKYFDKVEKLDTENDSGFADNIELRRVENKMNHGDFDGAIEALEDFRARRPECDEMDRAEFLRARLMWIAGSLKASLAAYRGLVEEFPDSEFRVQAEMALNSLGHLIEPPT